MKHVVLCADDFGQSAAIGGGILQLVEAGRLSAVSCMTEADAWLESAPALARHQESIDIGVHFNLTHPCGFQSWSARPLGTTLLAAMSGGLDQRALATTLHAQLDRFESVMGKAPDFIDGHQHVHILPGIRTMLLHETARRYPRHKPYLRNVNPRLQFTADLLKTLLLKTLNAGFVSSACRAGIPSTRRFGGIYSLSPATDFAALMERWLASAQSGDLIMCHPGNAAFDAADPIAATRPRELQHLLSDDFVVQLQRADVRLSRFIRPE
jgi:chitin disaccharide deacetylase